MEQQSGLDNTNRQNIGFKENSMLRFDTVLFDLDGTTIDTNELIIESIQHVWTSRYGRRLEREVIIPQMGRTLEQQFQAFTGEDDVSELVAEYRKFNYAAHDDYVKPFPYVQEVLRALRSNGAKLGVVTTKKRASTMRSLAWCGLDDLFDVIVTLEDVTHPKPHPEPVLTSMKRLGAIAERTLMVGDSPFDIQSAHAAGAVSAAVGWSLKGEQELLRFHPQHIIRDMRELLPLVGIPMASVPMAAPGAAGFTVTESEE
jgi:pyrophosphatase PpaX